VHAEALAVIVAVTADFVFNRWDLEILPYYHIQHMPWCVCYHAQSLSMTMNVLDLPSMFSCSTLTQMSYREGALDQLLPLLTPEYTLVLKQIIQTTVICVPNIYVIQTNEISLSSSRTLIGTGVHYANETPTLMFLQ
jgi:hypothetical protein